MRKIASIEGLRGLLALWVLLGHVLAAAGLGLGWSGPLKIIPVGGYAVEVFIIISGFVIFYLLDTARESYARFMWRRFLRLYPVYLVCLLASMMFLETSLSAYADAPWPHPLNTNRVDIIRSSLAHLPQHLAAHLVMVHSMIPDSVLPYSAYAILGVAWSLSLEWQFYALAPLIFVAFAKGPRAGLAVIALACAIFFLVPGQAGFLPRHVPMFALGIASYYLWRHTWRPQWPLLAPVGIALTYLLTESPPTVIWAAVFLTAYQPESFGAAIVNRVLSSQPALFLGRISYAVYLSHSLVLVFGMLLLKQAGIAQLGQWTFFAILLAFTLAVTLAVSALLYKWVEAPFISMGKRQAVAPLSPPKAA